MYSDQMEITRQPFQYDVDTDFFFPGGARGDVVEDLITALSDAVPLVTLAGTDGSGKTMICRMVEQRLGGEYLILFFENGVESFDEVLEGISARTGIDQDDSTDDRNLRLKRIVEVLKQEGNRLIVIIDGAESIFLATLERIRRMVALANGDTTTIQLLLSGQPLFLLKRYNYPWVFQKVIICTVFPFNKCKMNPGASVFNDSGGCIKFHVDDILQPDPPVNYTKS